MARQPRILTMDAGGNTRSVAMAMIFKENGFDAMAVGTEVNSAETIRMLAEWADGIIVMVPEYAAHVPAEFRAKVRVCDVGPDVWLNPFSQELLEKCRRWAATGRF